MLYEHKTEEITPGNPGSDIGVGGGEDTNPANNNICIHSPGYLGPRGHNNDKIYC